MKKMENKNEHGTLKLFWPAIRVVILILVVTGIAYPLILLVIGQEILPFQSNGSIVNLNGKPVGSTLIAQNFTSPEFFHPRAPSDSASGVDPHITPEDAFSQVKQVSQATGIAENPLKTLIMLNIERNKSQNLGAFAPDYVNVLKLNLDLIDQYPDVYSEFSGGSTGIHNSQ
jgi:potassium-transporting ATPase KdpC subunit